MYLIEHMGYISDLAYVYELALYEGQMILIYSKRLSVFQSFQFDGTIGETMIKEQR